MTPEPKCLPECDEGRHGEDCPWFAAEQDYWFNHFGLRRGDREHNRKMLRSFAPPGREHDCADLDGACCQYASERSLAPFASGGGK